MDKDISIDKLKQTITSQLALQSCYFGGSTILNQNQFETIKKATIALTGCIVTPGSQRQSGENNTLYLMERAWRDLLSQNIETLDKDGQLTLPADAGETYVYAALETVKRFMESDMCKTDDKRNIGEASIRCVATPVFINYLRDEMPQLFQTHGITIENQNGGGEEQTFIRQLTNGQPIAESSGSGLSGQTIECSSGSGLSGQPIAGSSGSKGVKRRKAANKDDLQVVIIGKTGSGKSSTGNTILGANGFKAQEGFKPQTTVCQKKSVKLQSGQTITIVDTPGIGEKETGHHQMLHEISRSLLFVDPGPQALLFVMKYDRFTEEDYGVFKTLRYGFDAQIYKYIIIVFTYADELETPHSRACMEEALARSDSVTVGKMKITLRELVEEFPGGYVLFSNTADEATKNDQVEALLHSISELLSKNSFQPIFEDQTTKEGTMNMEKRIDNIMKNKQVRKPKAWEVAEKEYHSKSSANDIYEKRYFGAKKSSCRIL